MACLARRRAALLVAVYHDPYALSCERPRVVGAPLALAVGRAGGHDTQVCRTTVSGLLAVHDEDLVRGGERVQAVQDRLLAGLLPRDPAAVG